MNFQNFFVFKTVGILTPGGQIFLICLLFVWGVWLNYKAYKQSGKSLHGYPFHVSLLFSSIYEEIIFRGFLMPLLMMTYSTAVAVAITSALFGLWHLKNIIWMNPRQNLQQILYTAIIFGPIASALTLYCGSIWPAVIVHYIHNDVLAYYSRKLFNKEYSSTR